jgi:HAE1 family hydrophobic/amphiphilic exporter-1
MELVDAMRESATIRFRPIVMTTVAMIAGMMPLALGVTEGAEFRKSMGTVIIGGLTSSLFLTLFLVPVVYLFVIGWVERIGRKLRARRARRAAQDAAADADGEVPASPAEQPQPVLR